MARFYQYEESEAPMTAAHDSGRAVTAAVLEALGVFYQHMPNVDDVDKLAVERGYANRDHIKLDKSTPGLTDKLDVFFQEHLHDDEEIRYITKGSGYFDVRGAHDEWIRCEVGPGDMLILPQGIFHRFTLTQQMYVEATRLFQDEPKWVAIARSPDGNADRASRREYLASL